MKTGSTPLFCEFKAAAVSCKVHKTIYKPEEEHQIVSDIAQEPIIAEEQWLRRSFADIAADLLRQAEKLVFGMGDIYPNCGKKLHFCTAKGLKRNQKFWRC